MKAFTMKRIICIALCAAAFLTGCGATVSEPAAEMPVQEQTAVQESSEMPFRSEEELTAELEEKRASLPEEEFIAYMNNDRRTELHLPESAVYNPELDEYYDSSIQEWDAGRHDYIMLKQSPPQTDEPAYRSFEGEIPAEMQQELDAFFEAENKRVAEQGREHPEFAVRSDWIFLDDTEHLRTLKANTQVQYFETWAEISKCWGARYAVLAIYMVRSVLEPHNTYITAEFADQMQEQLALASDAVNALGDGITAEDVAALQETYGYMIAPALQDMGKLDLLQIAPESPCRDAGQLAAFARYFA